MVSKDLRDERAAKLKTMTPAQRKSQVNTWGREYDQGKTPSGPSAGYKPAPPKPKPSVFNMGFGTNERKPLANLKSPGRTSYVPNTSQGGFSGRKDPRQQAIENLIRERDKPKAAKTYQNPPPPMVTGPVDDPYPTGGIDPSASVGAWTDPTQGAWWQEPVGTYGNPNIPGSGSHPVNPTGVGFANVAPGDMTWGQKHFLEKYGPEGPK